MNILIFAESFNQSSLVNGESVIPWIIFGSYMSCSVKRITWYNNAKKNIFSH